MSCKSCDAKNNSKPSICVTVIIRNQRLLSLWDLIRVVSVGRFHGGSIWGS